ncbi:HD domain-containing protein [Labilibacter sediminis]|nr:HD domain-containing protein [Labilibacter sediminis]
MAEIKTSDLVQECMQLAQAEIEQSMLKSTLFHNWEHTKNVFQSATLIAENTPNISEREMELLQIATLFHDITANEEHKDHEIKGAEYAETFLISKNVNQEDIELVKRLVLVTKLDNPPTDVLEQIIKDADLSHIGNNKYLTGPFINLYKELSVRRDVTPKEWIDECIVFFNEYPYYTYYAKKELNKGKEKNKLKLELLLQMDINNIEELIAQIKVLSDKPKKTKKKKGSATKKDKPDKGVETMFRVALRNHTTLSKIADDKANTLISVNAIIISIVLSALFPKLDNNPYLLMPALILLAFSVLTIIISIISTIPRTTHGVVSKDDVNNKRGNLIFFGNFHQMRQDDFEWGMGELMKDKDYLYKSLMRDLYFLGKVLKKKYTFLRYGYFSFVTGLILSIVVFVIKLMESY